MQESRYIVKFTNSFWKVFDRVDFSDVKLHYLRTEAEQHAEFLNK